MFEWHDRVLYVIFRHVSAFCVSTAYSLCCIIVDRTERADNIRKRTSADSRGCAARLRTNLPYHAHISHHETC